MIKYFETDTDNFYIFVSHKENGKANVSYGLVSSDKKRWFRRGHWQQRNSKTAEEKTLKYVSI